MNKNDKVKILKGPYQDREGVVKRIEPIGVDEIGVRLDNGKEVSVRKNSVKVLKGNKKSNKNDGYNGPVPRKAEEPHAKPRSPKQEQVARFHPRESLKPVQVALYDTYVEASGIDPREVSRLACEENDVIYTGIHARAIFNAYEKARAAAETNEQIRNLGRRARERMWPMEMDEAITLARETARDSLFYSSTLPKDPRGFGQPKEDEHEHDPEPDEGEDDE